MGTRLDHRPDELRIAGLVPFSTVDWPGRITATLFLQGCPWDCFYCHNPALIDPRAPGAVAWSEVDALLAERAGLLDGVVFSGGEPTMQRALTAAMDAVGARGFAIGLHTCGAFPALLPRVLEHVDWVGLDIKAAVADYPFVTGRAGSGEHAWKALDVVLDAVERRRGGPRPLDYEVRTTIHSAAIDEERLGALGTLLADAGVRNWAVQRFRDTGTRTPLPRAAGPSRRISTDAVTAERFDSLVIR